MVELAIPVRRTRGWGPEYLNIASGDVDVLTALLPPHLEKLTLSNWEGCHLGPWFLSQPDNGLSCLMALAEAVAALRPEEARPLRKWSEVALEVELGWSHANARVPNEVAAALVRIGLDVWVNRWGGNGGKLEVLPGASGGLVVEL